MTIRVVDAFDLPEWLGTEEVVWSTGGALADSALVAGRVTSSRGDEQQLDLLAVDAAFPSVVCPEPERRSAHQAWTYGAVVLVELDDRLAAAVPGTRLDPNLACEVIRRVAKSVGAAPSRFTVSIGL